MKTVLEKLKAQKTYKPADPHVDKINKIITLGIEDLYMDVQVKFNKGKINLYDIKYSDLLVDIRKKYDPYINNYYYSMIIIIEGKPRLLKLNERNGSL